MLLLRLGTLMLIFLITNIIQACDPPPVLESDPIRINAEVLNPKDTIPLGDSVGFTFTVPDTIDYNGTHLTTFIGDNDGCGVSMFPRFIEPVNRALKDDLYIGCFSASIGGITSRISLDLGKINGKFVGKFFSKPSKKRMHFLEVQTFGYITINNGAVKGRNTFSFGNVDRHHQMLIDYVGSAWDGRLYLQDKYKRDLEVYAFYVK